MELTTTLVKLCKPVKSDAADLYRLRTDVSVNKYIYRPVPQHIAAVEEFIDQRNANQNDYYFIIKTISNGELIGAICLKNIDKEKRYAEVGYELMPTFQGQGLMTSALGRIIDFAFTELGLHTIEAFTHEQNLRSRKLLASFNFELIPGKTDDDNLNNVVYCLKKPHDANESKTIWLS